MAIRARVLIEGYSPDEILALPDSDIASIAFTGNPVVVRIGSSEVLAEFRATDDRLVVELAQVDDGGEGVLLALAVLARRYASSRGLPEVQWVVHALDCARPNLKLQRVLLRRGFAVKSIESGAQAYVLIERAGQSWPPICSTPDPQ